MNSLNDRQVSSDIFLIFKIPQFEELEALQILTLLLFKALSTFPLTHDQVVARRMLKHSQMNNEDASTYSPNHSTSVERPPTANRSFSKAEGKGKDKSNKKKDTGSNKSKDSAVKRGNCLLICPKL